jgi:hypothetical protein
MAILWRFDHLIASRLKRRPDGRTLSMDNFAKTKDRILTRPFIM